jgi:hypothetical protein
MNKENYSRRETVNMVADSAKLVKFLSSVEGFNSFLGPRHRYEHMGATLSDAILQAGLNYRTVVAPRIKRLVVDHPEANTTSEFQKLIAFYGLKTLLNWKDPEKPSRIMELTWFFASEGLETESMARSWLQRPGNARLLLQLHGIGPKTVDYLSILVGISTLAVDRHIMNLLVAAGLQYSRYEDVKNVACLAADRLGVSRESFDQAVWMLSSAAKASRSSDHFGCMTR